MGLLDYLRRRGKPPVAPLDADGLPQMSADAAPLADAARDAKNKEAAARQGPARAAAENEGLPSVNRRRGGNRLATVLGFAFVVGAGAALIVAVNGDKQPHKKKNQPQEPIASKLPPIAIPAAPPPIDLAAHAPATAPPAPGAQPIGLQQGARPAQAMGPNGKPPLSWTDRKMGGALLVGQPSTGAAAAVVAPHLAAVAVEGAAGEPPAAAAFAAPAGRSGGQGELSARLEPTVAKGVSAALLPDRNFLVAKGTALDCALETALDSSVPGLATCRLTRDVYSDNGQVLLLDRGSQLVGEYQGGLKQGQVRLFVLWTRAKTPNGVIVALNSPGTDALGRSGLDGWVDNHFAERFGAAILMSFIKDSVTALLARKDGVTNIYGGTVAGGDKIVEKILESTVNIPPTIVKNQGDHIQVMVARDLDFSDVYALKATR